MLENRNYTLLAILVIVTAVAVSAADAAGIPKKAISTVSRFLESDLPTTTVFTDTTNTLTGGNTFQHYTNSFTASNTGLAISNPSNSFGYILTGGAITANRTLNLPVTTGTDTLATLDLSQIWTGTNTFNALTLGGQMNLASNTMISSGHVYTFPSNTGTIMMTNGTLSGATLSGSSNTVTNIPANALPLTTVYTNQANTYTAGDKQTFQNSGTTAGLNLAPSTDPSSLANGDTWLSSTNADVLKYSSSGTTYEIQSSKGVADSTTKATPGTGTTSTTFVAAGLGATVTPTTTGRILVIISVNVLSGTSLDGANIQIMHGTGTAPTHNTAPSGQTNDCISMDVKSSGTTSPGGTGTISCVITGLTIGSTYWVDLEYDTDTSAKTATLNNAIVSIIET